MNNITYLPQLTDSILTLDILASKVPMLKKLNEANEMANYMYIYATESYKYTCNIFHYEETDEWVVISELEAYHPYEDEYVTIDAPLVISYKNIQTEFAKAICQFLSLVHNYHIFLMMEEPKEFTNIEFMSDEWAAISIEATNLIGEYIEVE